MVDKETVKNVANLSKLKLKEDDVEIFSKQFNDILNFIDKLNELDVKDVEPFYEINIKERVDREDIPQESLSNEEVLKNAPESEGGFFVVPRVVGES